MSIPIVLQGITPTELASRVPSVTEPETRKLLSAVHRKGMLPVHAPPPVRRTTLQTIREIGVVGELEIVDVCKSHVDPFVKYAFRSNGREGTFEAVRIPLESSERMSVCVSSQVGCALACRFCATGRMGLIRNLEAWEIVEQVRRVRSELPSHARIHGVVFQGMGEPLANLENVVQAARVLSDASCQAIDAKAITICTAGLPTGIRRLAELLPNVRLGWSIGVASVRKRSSLMPIDTAYSLAEVVRAVGEHAQATGRAPLWAYTLLSGVNDGIQDAEALAELALAFAHDYEFRPRISLIPYNAIGADANGPDPFARSSEVAHAEFAAALALAGVGSHRRYSGGADVGAACGQLAARL